MPEGTGGEEGKLPGSQLEPRCSFCSWKDETTASTPSLSLLHKNRGQKRGWCGP